MHYQKKLKKKKLGKEKWLKKKFSLVIENESIPSWQIC